MVLQPLRQSPANKYVELLWNGVLIICPTVLAAIVQDAVAEIKRRYGQL